MPNPKDSTICCPEFNTKLWDEKSHAWRNKLFIQDNVVQFMHIPLNMGQVITRMWKKIQEAKAEVETKDFLMLAYDPSPWKSEIYMTIAKEVPGAKNTRLSGTFLSKVFDGPYNAVPKFIKEMDKFVETQGKKVKKYYFYYAYCPKCAKKYGHNYVVAFAEV
jgi:hypothetical protein